MLCRQEPVLGDILKPDGMLAKRLKCLRVLLTQGFCCCKPIHGNRLAAFFCLLQAVKQLNAWRLLVERQIRMHLQAKAGVCQVVWACDALDLKGLSINTRSQERAQALCECMNTIKRFIFRTRQSSDQRQSMTVHCLDPLSGYGGILLQILPLEAKRSAAVAQFTSNLCSFITAPKDLLLVAEFIGPHCICRTRRSEVANMTVRELQPESRA
mmetsp:Transcript_53494/g.125514  ORF Transcript_53494/g.125514 Transcript_53494/m.125514 type:complete len:212 (-) Transcript_53494:322-957(-)